MLRDIAKKTVVKEELARISGEFTLNSLSMVMP